MEKVRINNDINGNPRYVIHFLNFLTETEKNGTITICAGYKIAVDRAKKIGAKKYRGKDFGGGIVVQSYNIADTIKQIKDLVQNAEIAETNKKK